LIDFLAFLVQKLWPKTNKIIDQSINYLIKELSNFELLIDFLVSLVQELWLKINGIMNYLISGLIINFVAFRS